MGMGEGNKPLLKLLPEKEPFGTNLRQAVSDPEGPEGKLILGVILGSREVSDQILKNGNLPLFDKFESNIYAHDFCNLPPQPVFPVYYTHFHLESRMS